MKYHPKTKPFGHQARGTIRAAKARNYALFFEPRLGKSKAALDYVGILALSGKVKRVLILCPAIAKDVWESQIDQHFPYFYYAETFEEEWSNIGKAQEFNVLRTSGQIPTVQFFIAGREETFRRGRNKKGRYVRPKQRELGKWDPDVVIVDESHEYKRAGGVAAKDCWRLVRRLRTRRAKLQTSDEKPKPWVLLMSGTPTSKSWDDLFAQYRIMDETILGSAHADFEENYIVKGVGKRKWTVVGYKNEKRLVRKIRDHSYAVSADEAGLANEQFFQMLKVDLPDKVKQMYLQMAKEFLVEWEGGVIDAKNAGVKRLRLLQITGGFTTDGSVIHRAKLERLKAYASLLLEQGESVVVYSRFTAEVQASYEALRDLGFRTFRVDGTVTAKDRRIGTESLRVRPPTPTAISFQHQAGSQAIELVGAAETIFYTVPDGWVTYWQILQRTGGPNQTRPRRYTHLVAPGTVDVSAFASLRRKEDLHQTMMRNPKRFLAGLIEYTDNN